jgi:5-methylcytosine-specific restriction endonuclease McrA
MKRDLKKELDKQLSLFTRLKNAENGYCQCVTCGATHDYRDMDCGHLVKRRHDEVRHEPDNMAEICKVCNHNEEDEKLEIYLIELHGPERIEELKSMKNPIKRYDDWYKEQIQRYRLINAELLRNNT